MNEKENGVSKQTNKPQPGQEDPYQLQREELYRDILADTYGPDSGAVKRYIQGSPRIEE